MAIVINHVHKTPSFSYGEVQRRAKKMTMEQAFEEGKRKEQFMTSEGAVRNER